MSSQLSLITSAFSPLKHQQNGNDYAIEADHIPEERSGSRFYIPQALNDVTALTDAVVKIGEPTIEVAECQSPSPIADHENASILPDVIYAVESLMAKNKEWVVPKGFTTSGNNRCYDKVLDSDVVSFDEILETICQAFDVDKDSLQTLREKAMQKQLARLRLHLTIGEADIQEPEGTKESINTFIRAKKGPKFMEEFETPQQKGTRHPRWKHSVEMHFTDLRSDCIHLELWNEKEEEKKKKRHFTKGSHPEHPKYILLAELILRVKDVMAHGITGWYDMESRFGGNMRAPTRVRLSGHISCTSGLECDALGNYEILLRCLLDHQAKKTPRENKTGPCSKYNEDLVLGPSARAALRQFAIVFNVSAASQCLSWWTNVTIQQKPLDWQLLLTQFNNIKASLVVGAYSETEQKCLSQSVSDVIDRCIASVKYLEECFPAALYDQSKAQLTSMLQTMKSIQTHPRIRSLLTEDNNFCLRSVIKKAALPGFSRQWWNMMTDTLLKQRSGNKIDLLQAVLELTDGVVNLFQNLSGFYDEVFIEEYDICCLKACYPVIVKDMMETVEPIITECCQSIPKSVKEIGEAGISFDFLIGSTLMKIYKNLVRVWRLRCPHLSSAIVEESGVELFNSFFEEGIENQLSLTEDREHSCLNEVVQCDDLQSLSRNVHFSTSLKEARAIPHRFKIWWFELVFPDQEDRAVFLIKVLRSLYFLSISYCQDLSKKAEYVLKETESDLTGIVNEKMCVATNNMVTIMNDIKEYHNKLGYKFLDDNTREKHDKEIDAMVNMSTLNVRTMMHNFILNIVNAKEGILEKSLRKMGQEDESLTFLTEVLYPTIDVLRKFLDVSNAKIILEILWTKIVRIVRGIVNKEATMEPEFYGRLLNTLQKIYTDLTPESSDEALNAESADTEEYKTLVDDLTLMEKTSTSLINLFYKKQFEEQSNQADSETASLVIRTWLQESNKLSVEVIMAKDITVPPEEAHKAPLEYYMKVEVMASENLYLTEKTPVLKEDPATFDKLFEFDFGQDCEDELDGTLVLTLRDRNLTRSDTFLGESVIPFSNIPIGEHYARNRYLKMFLPDVSEDRQKILQILYKRDADKNVSAFLKRLRKHHPHFAELQKKFKQ